MRVLILCAGEGARWGDYLGVPKHLAPLCGERIIDRTVRLLRGQMPDAAIRVVVADMADRRYAIPGTRRVLARLDDSRGDADKFASSVHLWADDQPLTIVYGDVWLSEAAAAAIAAPVTDWRLVARLGDHRSGVPGGECFAFSFAPAVLPHARAALDRVVGLYPQPLWRNGGWEWYRALCRVPDDRLLTHADYGHLVEVDDWTQDMDGPVAYDRWCWDWAHADPDDRPPMWEG